MTPPAARAALAAALHDHIADWAADQANAIVQQLTADGWDITPARTTSKETTTHGR